jgi:hypothetical protein
MRRTHEDQDEQGVRRRAAALHGLQEVRRVMSLPRQSIHDLAPPEVVSVVWHNFRPLTFCKVCQPAP